jgi:hypothetical protein
MAAIKFERTRKIGDSMAYRKILKNLLRLK